MSDYVTFRLDGRSYATRITAVREVVRLAELVALPGMVAPVAGVLDLRGSSLPVVDIRTAEGRGGGDVLIVESGGTEYGFACDAVDAVVDSGELRPENGRAATNGLPDYVEKVLRGADGPVFLVDLARMAGEHATVALAALPT